MTGPAAMAATTFVVPLFLGRPNHPSIGASCARLIS
jgi:hypothetical protein